MREEVESWLRNKGRMKGEVGSLPRQEELDLTKRYKLPLSLLNFPKSS